MSNPYEQTIITDTNAIYYGVKISDLMEAAGKGIANELIKKYGKKVSYSFVCGLGNNGGDGFAAARYLRNQGVKNVKVYLIGRQTDLKTVAASEHWQMMKKAGVDYLQDAYGRDLVKTDIIVECLIGTGIKGKLFKRFGDVIYRATRLKSQLVAIDVPVPGYKHHFSISMMYPKTDDAVVVDLPIPDHVNRHTGPGEVKVLVEPKKHSYKSQNGKVLIIGGSQKYHGAPILAAKAAANYAGYIYLYSPIKDQTVIHELEKGSNEFISVSDEELQEVVEQVDSLLIGPGLENNFVNESLLNSIIARYPDKKYVIDAQAIAMTDISLVKNSGNIVFTPHRGEITYLGVTNGKTPPESTMKRFAVENNCYVNLKGAKSLLFGRDGEFKINISGNAGMAKAGTGDALAGLTTAFASTNPLWLSMAAAAFANGIAGELAAKKYGTSYSVEETISYQQQAIKLSREF